MKAMYRKTCQIYSFKGTKIGKTSSGQAGKGPDICEDPWPSFTFQTNSTFRFIEQCRISPLLTTTHNFWSTFGNIYINVSKQIGPISPICPPRPAMFRHLYICVYVPGTHCTVVCVSPFLLLLCGNVLVVETGG